MSAGEGANHPLPVQHVIAGGDGGGGEAGEGQDEAARGSGSLRVVEPWRVSILPAKMTQTPVRLTQSRARAIWLHAQRLDAAEPFGSGAEATPVAVAHLGYVQIDTTSDEASPGRSVPRGTACSGCGSCSESFARQTHTGGVVDDDST